MGFNDFLFVICPTGGFGGSKGGDMEEPERPAPMFCPKDLEESELFDLGVETGVNFDAYSKIPIKVTGEGPVPSPAESFEDMKLRKVLLDNVQQAKYTKPTPIQKHAIPIFMNQRDLMACAQTGSGKTVSWEASLCLAKKEISLQKFTITLCILRNTL